MRRPGVSPPQPGAPERPGWGGTGVALGGATGATPGWAASSRIAASSVEPARAYSVSAQESRPRPAMWARGVTRGTTRPARRLSPFRPPALIAQGAAGGAWGACQLVVASVREGDSEGAPQPLCGDPTKPPTTPSISSGQIEGYGAGIVTT